MRGTQRLVRSEKWEKKTIDEKWGERLDLFLKHFLSVWPQEKESKPQRNKKGGELENYI